MRAVRFVKDGKLAWWDAPDPDNEFEPDELEVGAEEIPDGAELIHLDVTPEEFEQALQTDCGSNEIGVPYLNDDVSEATDVTTEHEGKPGRRVGHEKRARRIRAYAPQHTNAASELMSELGRRDNQSVSWGELSQLIDRINGNPNGGNDAG